MLITGWKEGEKKESLYFLKENKMGKKERQKNRKEKRRNEKRREETRREKREKKNKPEKLEKTF